MGTKVLVIGSKGRMGQSILDCARQDSEIEIVGAVDKGEPYQKQMKPGVVVIDFTIHTATLLFAKAATKAGCPMVIGTTGFTCGELDEIRNASKAIPVLLSPNMSVGVNLLFTLTQLISSVLKEGFDVEIIEKHHRQKKDSPSGTAVRLAEIVAAAKGLAFLKLAKYGRHGDSEKRTANEIGIHSIRGGDYVGEHTVIFAGEGQVVEVVHRANSRDIFAQGALRAAKWISSARPGLYDMRDVLGLQGLG